MRVFVLFVFVYAVTAAPQHPGYDYQIQVSPEQYFALQQLSQKGEQTVIAQQQQTLVEQPTLLPPEVAVTNSQTVTGNSGGYQFANQLVQQAQQLVQYEQNQHQQQHNQQQTQTIATVQPEKVQHEAEVPVTATAIVVQTQEQQNPQQQHVEAPATQTDTSVNTPSEKHAVPSELPAPLVRHHQQAEEQKQQQQQQQRQLQQYYEPQNVQFNKEFFYLSAPQEDFDQSQDLDNQLEALKRNIRVIFIKAPEQNALANAALQLAKQSADQQTAIYVLTKQHDVNELAHKLQQVSAGSHAKPEVMFVKYRTPQEAEHAQRTIQAQYEALNGPNNFNHEGVAPTHNFIGSAQYSVDPRFGGKSVLASKPDYKYLPALKAKL